MNKAKRAHLLWCMGSSGIWDADYRWHKMRQGVIDRRFKRADFFAWWMRSSHHVTLKPKRGQKR